MTGLTHPGWIYAPPPPGTSEILRIFVECGPTATRDLIGRVGTSAATVAKSTGWLRDLSIVVDRPELGRSKKGRPTVPLGISQAFAFLGVQIVDHEGLPAELVGVGTDLGGRILDSLGVHRVSLRDSDRENPKQLVASIAEFIKELSDDVDQHRIIGAGVSVCGHVEMGTVHSSPGIGWGRQKRWQEQGGGMLLRSELQQLLRFPVAVDNDITALTCKILLGMKQSNAETWQEDSSAYLDDLSGSEDFAVICLLGEGVGGGLVQRSRLMRGAHGLAMEPGHLVIDYGETAELCRCGNRGCLESYTAPARILAQLAQEAKSHGDSQGVISMRSAALRSIEDVTAKRVFATAGSALGRGCANVVNVCDPGKIYIYAPEELLLPARGSAATAWLEALHASFSEHAFSTGKDTSLIHCPSTFLDLELGSAQGAACLCVEGLVDELVSSAHGRPPDERGFVNQLLHEATNARALTGTCAG